MRARTPSRIAVLVMSVALAACDSSSSVAPEATPPGTLFQPLALSISSFEDALSPFPLFGDTTVAFTDDVCSYTASAQRFTCDVQTFGGVVVTPSYTLLDASGASMPSFDQTRTAAVRISAGVTGTLKGGNPGYVLAVEGSKEEIRTGLLSARRILNGSSSFTFRGNLTYNRVDFPIDVTVKGTITDVVYAVTETGQGWPLSGTVSVESVYAQAGSPPSVARTTVTFRGTATVGLVTLEEGVTRSCTLDLSKPGSLKCA